MTNENKTTGANSAAKKVSGGIIGLLLLTAILIAANVILSNARIRADFTEQKLYTLSDGTKNLLQSLDRKVALKLFFSDSAAEMPVHLKTHARQVEDLLNEYRIASKGKISVTVLDPKPDSDEEDLAKSYGISGNNVGMFGPQVYFGLAAVAGETKAIIPGFDPRTEGVLEYSLSRLIYGVTHPEKPTLGVISSLPVLGSAPQRGGFQMPQQRPVPAWLSFQDVQRDFTMREISSDVNSIPGDIDALLIVHPKGLSDTTLYAIDQFVLGGGHLLAFLDPFSIIDVQSAGQQQFGQQPDMSSNMERLLTAWGIAFSEDQIVADMKAVTMLRGANNQPEENPVFLSFRKLNKPFNSDDILTSQLDTMLLPLAGHFTDNTSDEVTVTPLLSSSDMSGGVSSFSAQFGTQAIQRDFKPEGKPLHLALRLAGKLKTAFPDGRPASGEEAADAAPVVDSLQEGNGTVILVGDTDLLYDQFCVEAINIFGQTSHRPMNDNLSFFANAVELISGSSDLIAVRSRGQFARPFEYVVKLEEDARAKWQEQEKALNEKLQDTRRQLSEMQAQKDASQRAILSAEQQTTIQRFRDEEVAINKELKEVRKSLRRNIEMLGVKIKVANIVVMPVIIAIAGTLFGLYRRKRM
jgi:ABC-type uncharacterized transport system involved in gliding motility auxiliary subunit